MYGGKKSGSRAGGKMAKSKSNGTQKQSVASWATSVIALIMAFANPVVRVGQAYSAQPKGSRLSAWLYWMMQDYVGYSSKAIRPEWGDDKFRPQQMIRGYGPMGAAYVFKKASSAIIKVAPVKSLIPRLGV